MLRLFLLCCIFGNAAQAQSTMDAARFGAHVTGRTITYLYVHDGSTGIERYLSGRRVMWSSTAGICQHGVWYESKGDICFRYDHDPEPKCWTVYDEPGGMRGVYTTRAPFTVIREMEDRDDPLICNDLSS
ncbi:MULTISPECIES: hypothetical protein [Rhodobacterales]|uniref:hypothetical protein n=1 Tax=Rhodobacterales TaxID=204455 RepID=UPI0011BD751A|nr:MULTISPECIES: hypothetical protein [Rhodobacterales]MDO6590274.1 hypothetical protein [Yoonia sp. 1_MG-2023]